MLVKFIGFDEEFNFNKYILFTKGEIYEVTQSSLFNYYIKDNNGNYTWYLKDRFKPLSEIRMNKLKKIK